MRKSSTLGILACLGLASCYNPRPAKIYSFGLGAGDGPGVLASLPIIARTELLPEQRKNPEIAAIKNYADELYKKSDFALLNKTYKIVPTLALTQNTLPLVFISNGATYSPQRIINANGSPASRLEISTSGNYAIRIQNHADWRKIIQTKTINGIEYYTPLVQENDIKNPNALAFYMIPVDKEPQIDSNGKVTLVTEKGIYRPMRIN